MIILPSAPTMPTVADTATMLFIHTMFPIAPPTTCRDTINITGKCRRRAVLSFREANRIFETVLEPEIKEPNIPIKSDTSN